MDRVQSAFGADPSVILKWLNRFPFEGLSFSGGDPFVTFDRMLEWLRFIHGRRPDLYFWAYTSGLTASEMQLRQLAASGLHEIRFNLAASGYDDPAVLELVRASTSLFQHVAVEIPALPGDVDRVLAMAPLLDRFGVDYLNLHDQMLTGEQEGLNPVDVGTHFLDSQTIQYDRRSSRCISAIARHCRDSGLDLAVHHCTLANKDRQMLARRRTMGTLLCRDHERVTGDGLLESRLVHPGNLDATAVADLFADAGWEPRLAPMLVHPDRMDPAAAPSGHTLAAVFLRPPLGIDADRTFQRTEILAHGA